MRKQFNDIHIIIIIRLTNLRKYKANLNEFSDKSEATEKKLRFTINLERNLSGTEFEIFIYSFISLHKKELKPKLKGID